MRLESHGLCWHNSQPTEFWWLSPRNQMKLTSQPAHFQPRLLHLGAAALPGRGNCISKFPELAELMLPSKTTLKMEDAKLQLQAESEPEPLHACPRLELPSGSGSVVSTEAPLQHNSHRNLQKTQFAIWSSES